MSLLSRNNGFIKPVLSLLILAAVVYVGIELGMPYYRYSALKADARDLARVSLGRVDTLQKKVYERALELKIPIGPGDVYVEKRLKRMHVMVSWSEEIDLFGIYQKRLDFDVDIDE